MRIPVVSLFDGFFISGVLKGICDDNTLSEIVAIDEILSHLKGRNASLYSSLDNRLQTDMDKLVEILDSPDYFKKDAISVAKRIDGYFRYLRYE